MLRRSLWCDMKRVSLYMMCHISPRLASDTSTATQDAREQRAQHITVGRSTSANHISHRGNNEHCLNYRVVATIRHFSNGRTIYAWRWQRNVTRVLTRRLMTVNSDLRQCMHVGASESGTHTGDGSASVILRPSAATAYQQPHHPWVLALALDSMKSVCDTACLQSQQLMDQKQMKPVERFVQLQRQLPSVLWHCWSGTRKSIRPLKILSDEVLVWSCLERGADCLHTVQLMPPHPQTPSSLASFKSRLVLPFWYQLTQVVMEKRPLNGCSSSSSYRVSAELQVIFSETKSTAGKQDGSKDYSSYAQHYATHTMHCLHKISYNL